MTDTIEEGVFIVDDDEAVRDSLGALIEVAGITVRTFATATEFLDALRPEWRGCLLLDVRMPDMSGLELQQRLVELGTDGLGVVIITGHGDVPMAVQALKAGAEDFIEKPFDDGAIMDCVRRVIADRAAAREKRASEPLDTSRVALLTPREHDVLEQLVIGRPNKLIGWELGISPRTVEIHRARVMQKTGAKSLSHLVRIALAAGIDPNTP